LTVGPVAATREIDVPFFDVKVTPATATEVARWILSAQGKRILLGHNLHSVYLVHTSSRFRELYERADLVVIDGWPIFAAARIAHGRGRVPAHTRIGSPDWIRALAQRSPPGPLRLYVLGGEETPNRVAQARLSASMDAECAGRDGFFALSEEERVVGDIRSFKPDLVLIGMGMPRQEEFLLRWLAELPPAVYATVGAAIHYLADTRQLSPRWLGRIGLEWLWRLVHEPRRLWKRYLVEPILLAAALVRRRRRSSGSIR